MKNIKNIKTYLFIIISIVIIGCSAKETDLTVPIYNGKILLSSTSGNSSVKILAIPETKTLEDNLLKSTPLSNFSNKITSINEYYNKVYVLVPDLFKIVSVDKINYKLDTIYDFSFASLRPKKIAFANATQAYVIFENSSKAYLLDLYNKKIARGFEVGNGPSDITVIDSNKVFISLLEEDSLAYIPSNTYDKVAQKIKTESKPYLLSVSKYNELLIVCAGNGKFKGDTLSPSNLKLQFMNPETFQMTYTFDIGSSKVKSTEITPISLLAINNNYAFLATDKGFFRINVSPSKSLVLLSNTIYNQLIYNMYLQDIVAISSSTNSSVVNVLDKLGSGVISSVSLPYIIDAANSY